jgi:predicted nucleic acid-binding protein
MAMVAADTSLAVAAFATWHEKHQPARAALGAGLSLVDHCALETYSVLTRLPPPHRVPAAIARDYLAAQFPGPLLRLSAGAYRRFVIGLAELGVAGGGAWDALVAATALAHEAEIVSCDPRAARVYERFGLPVRML